ncbi:MAG: M48 family metalloprotease, partial [Candidatus Omnitrophica bacterium]|nr:M48 family metalloprotease [Candidatus Omnitrophota bacterium]
LTYDLIAKGYSRKDEFEADRIGVRYAHKAGYDPRAMISFLNKMKEEDKSPKGLVFLRTHPYPDQRIAQLETEIPLITNQPYKKLPHNPDKIMGSSAPKQTESKPVPKYPDSGISVQRSSKQVPSDKDPVKSGTPGKKLSGSRPGRVMCPECKKVFSGQTNYCPYDGKKLE